MLPIKREELRASEDAWLRSETHDEYGRSSYFVHNYYSADEKQSLWTKRGDHDLLYWNPSMRRPEPIVE